MEAANHKDGGLGKNQPTLVRLLHETYLANGGVGKSYQDNALGSEGATLGQALFFGVVKPNEAGDFIRDSLQSGSIRSLYWRNTAMLFLPDNLARSYIK